MDSVVLKIIPAKFASKKFIFCSFLTLSLLSYVYELNIITINRLVYFEKLQNYKSKIANQKLILISGILC